MNEEYLSAMKLIKIAFDEFSFNRVGFKSDSKMTLNMNVQIGENNSIYIVSVSYTISKEKEYVLKIKLSGYFEFDDIDDIPKKELLEKNAVAILLPYIRSEITLLTSQPETDSVVLPIFDVTKLMDGNQIATESFD